MRSRLSRSRRRSSTKPDFGLVARSYEELRPADANWHELIDVVVREGDLVGRRVLDIGCGTGRSAAALAERGARVWGVEPSPEMAALARERLSTVKIAPAERLPFKDGWFERALMQLVIHLVERPQAFAEADRVLGSGGRLVIVTFGTEHFEQYWLNTFFPSLESLDRARFPTSDELVAELRGARFDHVRLVPVEQHVVIDRDWALTKVRGWFISTLQLLPEEEFRSGLERMEAELPERVKYALGWLVAVAHKSS
jgi:ubiquinone/menaquinone biosynthesis C-methylase UbiE